MSAFDEHKRTDTPTQFDLARWLFERITKLEGEPKSRLDCLELMSECMAAIRPFSTKKAVKDDGV